MQLRKTHPDRMVYFRLQNFSSNVKIYCRYNDKFERYVFIRVFLSAMNSICRNIAPTEKKVNIVQKKKSNIMVTVPDTDRCFARPGDSHPTNTQRNRFKIISNQTEIRLY